MVIKILSSSATYNGITYNFDKVATGMAELMAVKNFGPLEGMDHIRPEDYKNYLQMLSARNSRIRQPQFHAVISAKGKTFGKEELTAIAEKWLAAMGYEKQPYLVFFHKDTDDNHVHIVSTRIDREGKKISSAFEHVRAVAAMNKIMGLDEQQQAIKDVDAARAYRFSTPAQFKLLLEEKGYVFQGNSLVKFGKKLLEIDFEKLDLKEPDQARATQLKAIFLKYAKNNKTDDFAKYLQEKHGVKLVFHAKDGKPAYGYTVVDHAQKNVYKGSAIMPLRQLLDTRPATIQRTVSKQQQQQAISNDPPIRIHIAADTDDEKIHGRRRKKKNKRSYDHPHR